MSAIAHPNQVTPEWITQALQSSGLTGVVTDLRWRSIGAGQVGDNARFELEVRGDLPTSLVGKFPAEDATSRETGIQLQNYAREVFFYQELAPTVDVQTPQIYAIEFDAQTHDFVLLMQDLAPGVQISQMQECSVDQAALALEQLARLHGPRWGDETLRQYPLLQSAAPEADAPALYQTLQTGFIERYQAELSPGQRQIVQRFGELQQAFGSFPAEQTLIHIDYRLDNLIFDGPYPLTVLDWQSINLGCALSDVSYFMGTSLSSARRAQHEQFLLRHYLEVLQSYSVALSWDDCWRGYRWHAGAGLAMSVIASMIVGETQRGNEMFMTMAQRSMSMCEDLQSFSLLQKL